MLLNPFSLSLSSLLDFLNHHLTQLVATWKTGLRRQVGAGEHCVTGPVRLSCSAAINLKLSRSGQAKIRIIPTDSVSPYCI